MTTLNWKINMNEHPIRMRFRRYETLKHAWEVNLASLKKQEEEDYTPGPEFKDLLAIYEKHIDELKMDEANELCGLQNDMRDYLAVVDAREEVEEKLKKLKYKMGFIAKMQKDQDKSPCEGGKCDNSC